MINENDEKISTIELIDKKLFGDRKFFWVKDPANQRQASDNGTLLGKPIQPVNTGLWKSV
jgi:hypothetical protein